MHFYCEDTLPTPDGAELWHAQFGDGAPPVVMCDGLGCDGFGWKHLVPMLAQRHRVVTWHYRGHGRSTVPDDPARVGVGYAVDDLAALLDRLGLPKAVVLGYSMGVQVQLEFHRRHPDRVLGLITLCGAYGHALDTVHDDDKVKRLFPYLQRLVEAFPSLARAVTRTLLPSELALQYALTFEVNRQLIRREDFQPYFLHLARLDPRVFLRTLESAAEHTAWDHLPRIDVPTLVIAADRDKFTPMWLSQRMHRVIPDSEMLVVPSGSHSAPIEQPELIALRILRFLRERLAA